MPKTSFHLFEIIKSQNSNWKLLKYQFSFFEIIENWTKMKWTFSYTDARIVLNNLIQFRSFNFQLHFLKTDFCFSFIRVQKRPFPFCLIFNNFKKMKIDFGQFSIQFLIFQITKKIENWFFWQFSIQFSIFNNIKEFNSIFGNFKLNF